MLVGIRLDVSFVRPSRTFWGLNGSIRVLTKAIYLAMWY